MATATAFLARWKGVKMICIFSSEQMKTPHSWRDCGAGSAVARADHRKHVVKRVLSGTGAAKTSQIVGRYQPAASVIRFPTIAGSESIFNPARSDQRRAMGFCGWWFELT